MAIRQIAKSIRIVTFSGKTQAEQAVEALHDAGFTSDQIRYSE
ncbi:MAG TPA: hypothetical protein VHZ51_03855 [Ktedonobacteraceae bacterium]|jgi:hypothetical protein|nr:hypothetical protein [Ktedonobacteraceae bacterium]